MDFIHLTFTLITTHFLCDFALQNDFVAKYKARYVDGRYNEMWAWVLVAHCAIHAIPVLFLTKSLGLSLLMFITHFLIDFSKCEKRITFNLDQILHLCVVAIIAIIYELGN